MVERTEQRKTRSGKPIAAAPLPPVQPTKKDDVKKEEPLLPKKRLREPSIEPLAKDSTSAKKIDKKSNDQSSPIVKVEEVKPEPSKLTEESKLIEDKVRFADKP